MQNIISNNSRPVKVRKKVAFLVVASVFMLAAYLLRNSRLYTLFNVGFACVGLLIDPILPLCINIVMTSMELSTSALISVGLKCLMTFPALIVYIRGKNGGIYVKDIAFMFAVTMVLILSWLFGVETQITTAILQFMIWMCYLTTTKVHTRKNETLLTTAFVLNGVYMSGVVLMQLITDSAVMSATERLTFEGSVRTLSTALAFPIFMIASWLIAPREKKLGAAKILLCVLTLLVMVGMLIITYSRGVLIAVILAVGYVLLRQLRNLKIQSMLLYFGLFICGAILLMNMEIDTELMFSNIEGGNGRFSIWSFFFGQMGEHGVAGYLFGLGPGDILRISEGTAYDGFYSHSVLLDYVFSYGLLGGCLLVYMVFQALSVAIRSKNAVCVGMLILAVTTYATSGNSASLAFPVLIGLTHSMAETEIQKRRQLQADSQQQETDFGRRTY